jgi:hypothetical protein
VSQRCFKKISQKSSEKDVIGSKETAAQR